MTATRRSNVLISVLLVIAASAFSACLGGLPHDNATHAVVTAPGEVLDTTGLPLHDDRDHWLMRDLPRWCGAAEARWGGNTDDRAVLTARAVRFRDEVAAMRALDKLTPEYLALTFRDRIAGGPWPVDYPASLPGDEAKANEYDVRLPPDLAAQLQLTGQQIAVRTGRALILTESIGLPPEELVPAIEAMVRAAEGGQGGC